MKGGRKMPTKKRSEKKVDKGEHCEGHCHCRWISMKLAIIAGLLFLLSVWPKLASALLRVPWVIYLVIIVS